MIDIDRELHALAAATRRAEPAPPDLAAAMAALEDDKPSRRWIFPLAAAVLVAVLAVTLTAVFGTDDRPAPTGRSAVATSPVSGTTLSDSPTMPATSVTFRIVESGGPAPGLAREVPGTISIHRGTKHGPIVRTVRALSGRAVRVALPAGMYYATANTPVIAGGTHPECFSGPVHLGAKPQSVTVICSIR